MILEFFFSSFFFFKKIYFTCVGTQLLSSDATEDPIIDDISHHVVAGD